MERSAGGRGGEGREACRAVAWWFRKLFIAVVGYEELGRPTVVRKHHTAPNGSAIPARSLFSFPPARRVSVATLRHSHDSSSITPRWGVAVTVRRGEGLNRPGLPTGSSELTAARRRPVLSGRGAQFQWPEAEEQRPRPGSVVVEPVSPPSPRPPPTRPDIPTTQDQSRLDSTDPARHTSTGPGETRLYRDQRRSVPPPPPAADPARHPHSTGQARPDSRSIPVSSPSPLAADPARHTSTGPVQSRLYRDQCWTGVYDCTAGPLLQPDLRLRQTD